MAEAYLGEIRMFGGNFAPSGWALCNGQLLPIAQNAALFSLLGTTYGGDGRTTFGLPNLQGRVPIHWGTGAGLSPYVVGQSGGVEHVTLSSNQMPSHNHVVNASSTPPARGGSSPATAYPSAPTVAPTTTTVNAYSPTANVTMNPAMIAPAGGNTPVPIIQPFQCVTFIIALVGLFPTRS
jgi:microcystin-dependent protein